jgi:hypothetical protein
METREEEYRSLTSSPFSHEPYSAKRKNMASSVLFLSVPLPSLSLIRTSSRQIGVTVRGSE